MSESAETPSLAPSDNKPTETTTQMLERLCTNFVKALDNQDFDFTDPAAQEVMSHLSPDWHARLLTYAEAAKTLTLAEQMAVWRKRAVDLPEVRYGIDYVFSHVNESGGIATVLVNMMISGVAMTTRYNMNECRWRRNDEGKWIWMSVHGIRGNPMSSGGVV